MKSSPLASIQTSVAYRFAVRYRLYHILFWVGYQLFWIVLFNTENLFTWGTVTTVVTLSIAQATGAYLNIYYFIPSFLRQQRYGWYALGFLLCVLLSSALTTLSYQGMYYAASGAWNVAGGWFRGTYPQFLGIMVMMGFTAVVFVMIIKLTKDWLKNQRHTQQLEKEKLETELKFLRSQFNPHFLFNTINSIHFLIRKDPELASDTLAKFSDLLRYQLYECNEARIPLKKEVHYLSNFVALEKLRNSNRLSVSLNVSENVNGAQVAPFILMPFVENAFKHASKGKQQDNFIRVALRQSPQQLQFNVENSKEVGAAVAQEAVHYGGIGLVNVRRRLALLYPQRHTLQIDERDNAYAVHLTLDLDEN